MIVPAKRHITSSKSKFVGSYLQQQRSAILCLHAKCQVPLCSSWV